MTDPVTGSVTEKIADTAPQRVVIYTDGACKGNPGPGGWGAILTTSGLEKEIFGGEMGTTNNRMELSAVIEALTEVCRSDFSVFGWSKTP